MNMLKTYWLVHENTEDDEGEEMAWCCEALHAEEAQEIFEKSVSPNAEVYWIKECETEAELWAEYGGGPPT